MLLAIVILSAVFIATAAGALVRTRRGAAQHPGSETRNTVGAQGGKAKTDIIRSPLQTKKNGISITAMTGGKQVCWGFELLVPLN